MPAGRLHGTTIVPMVFAHTYYLPSRDRWLPHGGPVTTPPLRETGAITLPDGTLSPSQVAARACRGERASDEVLCMLLRATWLDLAGTAEPTPVDGVSAWLDEAGGTQLRWVRNGIAEVLNLPDVASRVHARLTAVVPAAGT